jgi:hypothetical protein
LPETLTNLLNSEFRPVRMRKVLLFFNQFLKASASTVHVIAKGSKKSICSHILFNYEKNSITLISPLSDNLTWFEGDRFVHNSPFENISLLLDPTLIGQYLTS